MYHIRPFAEKDRLAVEAIGVEIIDYWDQHVALHLVAGDPVVGHLQVVDRGTTPSRRPGSIEMRLTVAPAHRRQGIGSRLYERALAFAEERQADSIRVSYVEHSPEEPAMFFLKQRGFVELQVHCMARAHAPRGLAMASPPSRTFPSRALRRGAAMNTRGACAPQKKWPRR